MQLLLPSNHSMGNLIIIFSFIDKICDFDVCTYVYFKIKWYNAGPPIWDKQTLFVSILHCPSTSFTKYVRVGRATLAGFLLPWGDYHCHL